MRIAAIDHVLEEMTESNLETRLSAQEALDKLGSIVNAMPPESLLVDLEVLRNY